MTNNQVEQAANICRRQKDGTPMTAKERTFLNGLLSGMSKLERAGAIAAIIKIMLGDK